MIAPFPVAILRGPTHIVENANEAMLRAWRKGPGVIGRPLVEALPELREQPYPQLLDDVYRTGVPFEGHEHPARLEREDGTVDEVYFSSAYVPFRDAAGGIAGIVVTGFDVTEQVKGRLALEVATRRLEAAQSVAGIGIFEWELPSDAMYWSPEVFKLLGLEPNAVTPSEKAWSARVFADDQPGAWSDFLRAARAHNASAELELRLLQPDGSTRWVRISSSIDYGDDGAPRRVLGAIVDIEALKRAAAVRAAEQRRLEVADRAKDEFLATMSHELRTPLTAILGWSSILSSDPNVDRTKLARGLSVIDRNARLQARLINDLLDVSRIISGKLHLSLKRIDPAAAIHAAAEVVRAAADAKGVELFIELDPNLGMTVADPDRLQQITWNLLTNAVRFTPSGGKVSVHAVRAGATIRIDVVDTGAGIPGEHLPHIFDRFRQVDSSTTRAHGGLGLGLAIVRHLVEAHGGTVHATSGGPNQGSTFIVSMPVVEATTRAAPPESQRSLHAAAKARTPETETPLRGVRALVVDDDADSLEFVRVALESAGAVVKTAGSASDALLDSGPFDILISDIAMPELDGYGLMERIRERAAGSPMPAIALTAYARREDGEHALRVGFQEHLVKPVEASRLVDRVLAWTRRPNALD